MYIYPQRRSLKYFILCYPLFTSVFFGLNIRDRYRPQNRLRSLQASLSTVKSYSKILLSFDRQGYLKKKNFFSIQPDSTCFSDPVPNGSRSPGYQERPPPARRLHRLITSPVHILPQLLMSVMQVFSAIQ